MWVCDDPWRCSYRNYLAVYITERIILNRDNVFSEGGGEEQKNETNGGLVANSLWEFRKTLTR